MPVAKEEEEEAAAAAAASSGGEGAVARPASRVASEKLLPEEPPATPAPSEPSGCSNWRKECPLPPPMLLLRVRWYGCCCSCRWC